MHREGVHRGPPGTAGSDADGVLSKKKRSHSSHEKEQIEEIPVSRYMDARAYAMYLGLNVQHSKKDQIVFTVLRQLFVSPLVKPWCARNDAKLHRIYFWHRGLAEATYRHPLEPFFLRIMGVLKENLFIESDTRTAKNPDLSNLKRALEAEMEEW